MSITENVIAIKAKIRETAIAAGRDPSQIQLCAATKMNGTAAVREAIAAGVDLCGENRVQELVQKSAEHAYDGVPVHFIGHLQTNKVRQVVGKVDLIQSVDRMKLLTAIQEEAARQGIVQKILLQINIGNEDSKGGFLAEEIWDILDQLQDLPNIFVCGLMAIPPISENPGDNCKYFQKMYNLAVDITAKNRHNVSMETLSMGMTDDFVDAIACGSTMIRVGTAIFGPRNYN